MTAFEELLAANYLKFLLFLSLSIPFYSYASPFETCPSKAFLLQGNPVKVYGVNLVSGTNDVLQDDVGTLPGQSKAGNVNGVGFDDYIDEDGVNHRYIYGFNTTVRKFVRLNASFQQTELAVTNQPEGNFFVGDVYQHHYYFYRKGSGLYKINLDENADNYLDVQTITSTASINLTDFAFHPDNDQLYGVDNNSGVLYSFNIETGSATGLGNTGELGTFGAGYFDVNGYYYVSRNQDGQIYRINLSAANIAKASPDYSAVKFADGPNSSQNDGARCANAPLIDESEGASTIDFANAPDSYNTTLNANGPRHELIDDGPFIGAPASDGVSAVGKPNGEVDANLTGDGDENIGQVTGFVIGLDNIILIEASQSAFLHAWADWNLDGDFADSGEQVLTNYTVEAGTNRIVVRVPIDASAGSSWLRLRIGSQQDLEYFGGATDGEVEDHSIEISDLGVEYSYYPSKTGWVTLAYEDLWPIEGDYDMNDVVFHYRTTTVTRDEQLQRVDVQGQLVAIGASYHNGFAVRIPGIQSSAVDVDKMRFRTIKNNAASVDQVSPIEVESSELIAIISSDVWQLVETDCTYYRTDNGCNDDIQFEFELSLPFSSLQPASAIATLYDPFIFATPNRYHGSYFSSHPGREWEMHLPDVANTELADTSLFSGGDDTSDVTAARYYKNSDNLPWAMEIGTEWKHPKTGVDLLKAYPDFKQHILSNKSENNDWYLQKNRNENKVFE